MPSKKISTAQRVAQAKAKALKMKADAKKKAAKMKAGSPTKKTGTPKTGYKYEKIESKSEMPKFKLEKEKKVKMKKKDLKLKKQSPAKMKLSKAKKAVRKGEMTPDDAGAKGLGYGKDYDKLVKSRAYKKQRADERGYKSVGKAKKAAKANDGFLPEGPAKMKEKSPMNMSGRSYDIKMAYDKKLTPKARLHYLENFDHDKDSAMKMGSPYEKHGSPYHKHGSPYHMGYKDSPMNKELVGKQHNLPEHLKKKIEAAPEMKGSPYHMSNELKYGGPVIDQMKTLSQAGSFKVLKHMKSKI